MQRRTRAGLALGGIGTTAALVAGLTAVFVAGGTVHPPAAQAAGLRTFADCAALHGWYVDHSLRDVGPYGWNGPVPTFGRELRPSTAGSVTPQADAPANAAVGSSRTGTNVQAADVDEPDIAKTDGRTLVRVVGDDRIVTSDVTGSAPRTLSSYRLPQGATAPELLLAGDHVVVIAHQFTALKHPVETPLPDRPITPGRPMVLAPSAVRVLDLDISDPTSPWVVADETFSGTEVSARQYGDVVRLVTTTTRPQLSFVQPRLGGSQTAATARNRQVVRASTIDDWLPSVQDNLPGADHTRHTLVGCGDVYHAPTFTGTDTITVTGFTADAPQTRSATAVTADGDLVYSSADALYVGATRHVVIGPGGPVMTPGTTAFAPVPPAGTDIHEFTLSGIAATYAASARLDGVVRDRWSMDEYDGHLRVALTWLSRTGVTRDNGIVVLQRSGDRLVRTGAVRGLGPGEEVQAVRWLDPAVASGPSYAALVTYRQIDPLFTVDLTDPTAPRAVGSLRMPGFSSYLHPIGDGRILGLGTRASTQDLDLGGQAAVFDISDLARPVRLSTVGFGTDTDVRAAYDPMAFTWLPDRSTGITTVDDWRTGQATVELLRVGADGSLHARVLGHDTATVTRALPLPDGRVALVGQHLRLVDVP